jgi:NADH-quinone oxidoreductase subunit A
MSTQFTPLFVFVLIAIFGLAVLIVMLSALLGPKRKTPTKQMPYESGMDPIGDARQRFDVRFYLVAIAFLLFDVELLFLYPWAVAHWSADVSPYVGIPREYRGLVFGEILVFIAVLAAAFAYAWKKGVFTWR